MCTIVLDSLTYLWLSELLVISEKKDKKATPSHKITRMVTNARSTQIQLPFRLKRKLVTIYNIHVENYIQVIK